MPINNNGSINPTSTVETFGPATRDYADANTYVFKALAGSGVCTLPKIENYPAAFVVSSTGASAQPVGVIHVTAAGTLVLSGASANLATVAGANVLVPAVSSGVLTLTANATWTARDIAVTRVG